MSIPVLRHELLLDVATHAQDVAMAHGIDKDLAEQVGYAIADRLANNWGGQVVSFPKDQAFKLAARDMDIYNDWAHKSLTPSALAQKYKLTVQQIYNIIKRAHKMALDARQRQLDL